MARYLLTIEYVGTGFHGFQRQQGIDTVQGALEQALGRFTGEEPRVMGSGRTDAGVHARAQAAAFDLREELECAAVMTSLNALLPNSISVTEVRRVSETFDPRRDALWREYRYFILNRPAPSALLAGFSFHVPRELDFEAMQRACGVFAGERDFSGFRVKGGAGETSTVRRVMECEAVRPGGELVCVRVKANAFLYRMVRMMAGAVLAAGSGRITTLEIEARLSGGSGPATDTLPSHGLFLWRVAYPPDVYVD